MSFPVWSDMILITGPCTVASIYVLYRETQKWIARRAEPAARPIVIDGSNVMYWHDGTPRIECVQDVVTRLSELGFEPGVMFDANAGYLFAGQYHGDRAISKLLKIPEKNVLVVPKGNPADIYILNAARDMDAFIITNDRFRDWALEYPEVLDPGYLIKGEYRQGRLWFDFAARATVSKAA